MPAWLGHPQTRDAFRGAACRRLAEPSDDHGDPEDRGVCKSLGEGAGAEDAALEQRPDPDAERHDDRDHLPDRDVLDGPAIRAAADLLELVEVLLEVSREPGSAP